MQGRPRHQQPGPTRATSTASLPGPLRGDGSGLDADDLEDDYDDAPVRHHSNDEYDDGDAGFDGDEDDEIITATRHGDQSRRPSTMLLKQMQLQQLQQQQSARSFSAVSNAGEIEQPLLMSLMALLKESEGTSASATCGHQRKAKRRPGAYNDRGGSRQSSSAESVPTWPIEGERRKSRAATAILPFLPHVPNNTPNPSPLHTRKRSDMSPFTPQRLLSDSFSPTAHSGDGNDQAASARSKTLQRPSSQPKPVKNATNSGGDIMSLSPPKAFHSSTTVASPATSAAVSIASVPSPTSSPAPTALVGSPPLSSSPPSADDPVQQQINSMTKVFSSWNDSQRNVLLARLLRICRMPQIHFINSQFALYGFSVDIVQSLPEELGLKVMSFLDPKSLCHAAQACRTWRRLAGDPRVWRDLVDQECYWRISSDEWNQMEDKVAAGEHALWKTYFSHHYRIKRNWMTGRFAVRTFEGHKSHVSCVQFDDSRIVSGSSDKTIRIWDIRSNTQCKKTLVGHEGTVRCLQFDNDKIVSGSNDCNIRVWDMNTGECMAILRGHTSAVRCLQMSGSTLVSGSYDNTIKVWDINSRACIRTLSEHTGGVLCLQFDKERIISGSADSTIKIWDFKSGECLQTLVGHNDAVTCLQFDANKIVSGSLDSSLKFWSIQTGVCVGTLDWVRSEGHKGVIRNLKFDEWLMISAADDKTIKIWNVQSGQRMLTLQKHAAGVTCFQFSFTKIVSGSYDRTIKVLNFDL